MMFVLLSSFTVCYLLMIPIFFKLVRMLKMELNYLPMRNEIINAEGAHPSVGLPIPRVFKQNNWFRHSPSVIMVADPYCASCKRELEEVLLYNKANPRVPIMVFLRNRDHESTQKYLSLYGSVIDIILIDENEFDQLNITINPSYILMDHNGVITSIQNHFLPAKKLFIEQFSSQKVG